MKNNDTSIELILVVLFRNAHFAILCVEAQKNSAPKYRGAVVNFSQMIILFKYNLTLLLLYQYNPYLQPMLKW